VADFNLHNDADYCNHQDLQHKRKQGHCGFCGKKNKRNRQLFCSRKCQYASGNNGRKPIPRPLCVHCGKVCAKLRTKYCSEDCRQFHREEKKAASIRPCRVCGKPCKSNVNVLCSKKCMGLEKSHGWVSVSCGHCGTVFQKKAYKAKSVKEHACSPECLKVVAARRAKEEVLKKYAKSIERKEIESAKKARENQVKEIENGSRTQWFIQACVTAIELSTPKRQNNRWKQKSIAACQTLKGRLVLPEKSSIKSVGLMISWELVLSTERTRLKTKLMYNCKAEWLKKTETAPKNLRQRICKKTWIQKG
jgi:hypothetical protein